MDILQDLRLGSGGITTEQNVDLAPQFASAGLQAVIFCYTAEQLAENSFLNV